MILGADVVADAEGYACIFGNGAALLYFLLGEGFLHYREDDPWNVMLYALCKGDEGGVCILAEDGVTDLLIACMAWGIEADGNNVKCALVHRGGIFS